MSYAFTITTKLPCRHCPVEFDNALYKYFRSKNIDTDLIFYKIEESKYTKWHAHGISNLVEHWNTDKHDDFFVYFKPITDLSGWTQYIKKSEVTKPVSPLDNGVPYFIPE